MNKSLGGTLAGFHIVECSGNKSRVCGFGGRRVMVTGWGLMEEGQWWVVGWLNISLCFGR